MNRILWAGTMLTTALAVASSVPASAQEYHAKLSGFQEIGSLTGPTGAILSTGQGTLKLTLDKGAKTLTYELAFSGLTNVLQAHIHFGKEHVAGGVMVFFCSNLGNGPAGTPVCPAADGTVTGMINSAGVVGPAAQNVTPGDFAAVVAALASNTAYANIHTKGFPAGEIRGQIHREESHHRESRDRGDGDDKGEAH